MRQGAINLKDVSLVFGSGSHAVVALEKLSLHVEPGEFLAILGPSGCGKSSLISTIAGFQPPHAGTLLVDGSAVSRPGSDRGVVFQQPTLFPWKSVRQNVDFGLRLRKVPRQERSAILDEILHKVGLSEFVSHYPTQLSRVLVNRPRVMLMDEPFGSLDAQIRLQMQELLLEVWNEFRMTILFVTHDIDEAIFLGSRVAMLTRRPGRLKTIIDVDLPRPRKLDVLVSPEFMRLKRNCMALLREETVGSPQAQVFNNDLYNDSNQAANNTG
jgi:NitT/TauT family transport system ATP-binding protein